MVKTLQYAGQKWARKTANAGTKWKARVTGADYCGGFSKFLGHTPSEACSAWTQGVGAVTAADFQAAISGKEGKYVSGLEAVK